MLTFKCHIDGRTFKTARGLKNHIPKTHHIQVLWYEARYSPIVAEKENWNLEGFAKFWQDIDLNEALRQKRDEFYDPDSCLGNSSFCDHDCENCSVGEEDEVDWEDEI